MESEPNNENIFYLKGNELFKLKKYQMVKIYYLYATKFNPSD